MPWVFNPFTGTLDSSGSSGGGVAPSALRIQAIVGTIDGLSTSFTVGSAIDGQSFIRLNQTVLLEGVDYTVSGLNITYTSAPPAGMAGKPHHIISL